MAFEVSAEFLAAIAGTILLMLLFLMVVVLWDIALALRDVAEKIDYLEDDVDSDLATINGTLTRIYDRMGSGGAGSGAGAAADGSGAANAGAAGVAGAEQGAGQRPPVGPAPPTNAGGGSPGVDPAAGVHRGGVTTAAGRHGAATPPMGAGGDAQGGATTEGATTGNAAGAGRSARTEPTGSPGSSNAADDPGGPVDGSVDPGTAPPVTDAAERESTDEDAAAGDEAAGNDDRVDDDRVDDEAAGMGTSDDGSADDVEGDDGPTASSTVAEDGPTPDAESANAGRFASDGSGDAAWYAVEIDLPAGARAGPEGSVADSPSAPDDRDRSGEGPFGLQRPGLRSQLESAAAGDETEADAADELDETGGSDATGGTDASGGTDATGGTDASGGTDATGDDGDEDLAQTTITDVASVSLADLHDDAADGGSGDVSDEAGPAVDDADLSVVEEVDDDESSSDGDGSSSDEDVSSTVEDVLDAADADPAGTDVDELADAFERRRRDGEDAVDADDVDADGDDADGDDADGDDADEDGGDIAELVNRELDTLTQEVGTTSMTPDVADEPLEDATDELDGGEYVFPLSGSEFTVEASVDAETATLRFTPDEPVELGGARERLLTYQLRNYLDRDDTTHAELSVDGESVVLDIPTADGPSVDAWADAAVQIIDRTLYLSKDED